MTSPGGTEVTIGPATGGTGPKAIWDALLSAGASSVQAAGIMGNFIAESSLNPEMGRGGTQIDSNGYPVYGLASWNAASYPQAASLVTGNAAADIVSQIHFLATTGGLQAASGSTVSETAGNFAAMYERCSSCQPGGSSYDNRVNNAQQVAGWAASGNWPASTGQAATTATLTAAELTAETQSASTCLWSVGFGTGGLAGAFEDIVNPLNAFLGGSGIAGEVCIISKGQARALIGAAITFAGGTILALGTVIVMTSSGFVPVSLLTRMAGPAAAAMRSVGMRTPAAIQTRRSASQASAPK